jgi:hypothetical protein
MKRQRTIRWRSDSLSEVPGLILLLVFLPLIVPLDRVAADVWFMLACGTLGDLVTAPPQVLFVYSNSPNWQEYIEQQILPRLPANTAIMNWSERKKWSRLSLPVLAVHYFCGDVIVIRQL